MRNLTALVAAAGIVFALTAVPAQADQAAALKAMAKSKIITWAQDPKVVAAIKAQNTKHASLDQASIIKLDKQWRAEAGKGFAVVASEVGNLANQTARATEEIGAQIAGIQSATASSVTAIQGITSTIKEIDQIATGIAAAVEEQGASTQEIARNVEQAAAGTQEVSANIVDVTTAAESTGGSAQNVQNSAVDLQRESQVLAQSVRTFMDRIQAA